MGKSYTIKDYIHDFGDLPYSSMPFDDGDAIAIGSGLYMPVEYVVSEQFEKEPKMTLADAAAGLRQYYGNKVTSQGLLLGKACYKNFMDLCSYPRFGNMKITACQSVYDAQKVVQFCGMTLFVDDDTLLVVFRGTDDTVVGWIEDFDIFCKPSIPSQQLALTYIEKVAKTYPDKKIMLYGHSKGGYVSLYTALNCKEETRKRIIRVYNSDGPGFGTKEPLASDEYREIRDRYRHYVPSYSFVGMLLYHDEDYIVIRSTMPIGVLQHDAYTWKMVGNIPDTLPELASFGKFHDLFLADVMDVLEDKENTKHFYSALCKVLYAPGQKGLAGIAANLDTSVKNIVAVMRTRTVEERQAGAKIVKAFIEGAHRDLPVSFGKSFDKRKKEFLLKLKKA